MKKSTARLALDLARSGISIQHCNARGLWQPLGTVSLTAPDFELSIARLRKSTAESFGENFTTEILLPADQIMFRAIKLSAEDKADRDIEIRDALAAMSRMEQADICVCEGITDQNGFTHVAAISASTLSEAVAFARKWGFNSRIVSTRMPSEGFDLPPVFELPRKERSKRPSKLPAVVMAGFAMALMLPAALQVSPDQGMPAGEVRAYPVEVIDEPQEFSAAPTISPAPEMKFSAPEEDSASIRVPTRARAVHKDVVFDFASNDLDIVNEDIAAVRPETGPDVPTMAGVLGNSDLSEDALALAQPAIAAAVSLPEPIAKLHDDNPAPEVVDRHAQLWVAKIPLQPAFRRAGPDFRRPDLNALHRTPGVMRLTRKLNFGPDATPGRTVVSADTQPDFLERTLEFITFDDVREQASLGLIRSTVFDDGAARQVANIGEGVLLRRPNPRTLSDETAPRELSRPRRRNEPLVVEPLVPGPQSEPLVPVQQIEAQLPPPDPDPSETTLTPSPETSVAVTRPNEAVLSSEPEVFLKKPRPRRKEVAAAVVAPAIEEGPEFPRPPRRPVAQQAVQAAPQEQPVVEPEVAATEAPIDTFTLPRPKRRALSPQQVATRTAPDNAPDSAYAIKTSQSPKARPKGLKAVAAKIRKERNSVDAIVAKTHAPKKTAPASSLRLPSNASVKKAATIRNGINQRKISLLGVTGTSSKRKALIRMPRGKIVTVRRGGRVDGWRVSAIGEQSVRLQKGNRSQVLRLPN